MNNEFFKDVDDEKFNEVSQRLSEFTKNLRSEGFDVLTFAAVIQCKLIEILAEGAVTRLKTDKCSWQELFDAPEAMADGFKIEFAKSMKKQLVDMLND